MFYHPARRVRFAWIALLSLSACSAAQPSLGSRARSSRAQRARPARQGGDRTDPPADVASPTPGTLRGAPSVWTEPFGPNGPVLIDRVAANGSWVSWCSPKGSARYSTVLGDGSSQPPRDEVTLTWAGGQSQPISGVLGQSPDGRVVAMVASGRWKLIDTKNRRHFDLNELGVDRRLALGDSTARSIAFHPNRPHVALLLRDNGHPIVAIVDIENGQTRRASPVSREVFRMAWEPSGDYLMLEEIVEDTNGNGHLDWPVPEVTTLRSSCGNSGAGFVAAPPRGDRPETTLIAPNASTAVAHPSAMMKDGNGWLELRSDHSVNFEWNGHNRRITPPGCEAHFVAAHGVSKQMLVGCYEKSRLRLGLASRQGFAPLNIEMPYADDFPRRHSHRRFLPVYSGASTYLVDFERSSAVPLAERDQLLAQKGAYVVVRRGPSLVRRDMTDGAEVVLAEGVAPGARVLFGNEHAWIDPYVIGADPAFAMFLVPRVAAALDSHGCALSYTEPSSPSDYPKGPLRWTCGNPRAEVNALTNAETEPNLASGSIASAWSTHSSASVESSGRKVVSRGRGAVVAAK